MLCLIMVEWLLLAVPWGCLRFVIVVFPDHTHYFGNKGSDSPQALQCVMSLYSPCLVLVKPMKRGKTSRHDWKLDDWSVF